MSKAYLNLYEKVMNGENINQNIPNRILKDEPKFLNWEA
jgi:hypothetical protein